MRSVGKGEIRAELFLTEPGGRDELEKVPEKSSASKCKQTMNVPLVVAQSYERAFRKNKELCCFRNFWPGSRKIGIWYKKGFSGVTRKIFSIGGMYTFDEQPPLFLPNTIEIN